MTCRLRSLNGFRLTGLLILAAVVIPSGRASADILLSGGLLFDAGSYSEKVYTGPGGDPTRKDESISYANLGGFGGLDLGMTRGSFGVHMANGLTLFSFSKSKQKGQLQMAELFLRTQLKYNLPLLPQASWSKKPNRILENIHPWIGVGPVMTRTLYKEVESDGSAYEPVLDLMDFGLAFTVGFNINFWKHYAKRSDFFEKMTGYTYVVASLTYVKSLTPDDENLAIDNASTISRDDFIIRIGSGLLIETSDGKSK